VATVRAADIPFLRPGAWAIALATLVFALSYTLRTELVAGSIVAERIEAAAKRHRIDIEVMTIRPAGLTGVRLVDVSVRVPRRGRAVEGRFESIEVYPRLGALLTGRGEPSEIIVRDGTATLVDYPLTPAATGKKQASSGEAPAPKSGAPKATAPDIDLHVEVHDVNFRLIEPIATHPLVLKRASIDWRGGTDIDNLVALGTLPDGQPFTTQLDRSKDGTVVTLAPNDRTRLDRWVDGAFPLSFEVTGVDVCIDCRTHPIRVRDVLVGVPEWRDDLFVKTAHATFTSSGRNLALELGEVGLVNPDSVEVGARLTTTKVTYDTRTGRLYGRVRFADTTGGTLDLDWLWTGRRRFELSFFADAFHTDSIWQLVEMPVLTSAGVARGSLEVGLDLDRRTVALESALLVEKATVDLPRLAAESLTFPRARVAFRALLDWRGRALSFTHGRLELGAAGPIAFRGQLVDTQPGWSFKAHTHAESLNALLLRDALPWNMTEVLDGAILDGDLGFSLTVAGHTAYPESLVMDGDIGGDVRVLRDGDAAMVDELAKAGPPPGIDISESDWHSYGKLPVIAPRVLLAAEDAKFFDHNGFDWPGFRRAMVHNLTVGELERGGSTLSQQVVKNVFLSRDRTVARKAQEAYLTWRMENALEKERILEIYLNIVEWGPDVRGVVQAARYYFDKDIARITLPEMALLAAILPNPHLFGKAIKAGRLPASRLEKMEHIFSNLRWMGKITPADYDAMYGAARRGRVGQLKLEVTDP
jgi:monofunctional biosynthetic peptidoglycan transglycosylase